MFRFRNKLTGNICMQNIITEIASCKNFNKLIKDENVTIFFKNLQNVTLASASYHTIPIELVITIPV